MRADMLAQSLLANDNTSLRLWWALKGRHCVGAAAVVGRPGRTGMLFHSPADSPGVDSVAMAQLIRRITSDAIRAGKLYFIQSLEDIDNPCDVEMIVQGGYEKLVELIYMERSLQDSDKDLPDVDEIEDVSWKNSGQFDDQQLGDVIAETYKGSMDCPAISGMRDPKDIIAGHKASGRFEPQGWSIAYIADEPVACILVNDFPGSGDITYMGVVSEHRGRSLSQLMLARAFKAASRRGLHSMTLAVDAANSYAINTYTERGFVEKSRRIVYFHPC